MSASREREPSSSWLPKMVEKGILRLMHNSANLKTADCASGAVSPLTWSPERMIRSGFSSSRTDPTKSRVRGSASHWPPL